MLFSMHFLIKISCGAIGASKALEVRNEYRMHRGPSRALDALRSMLSSIEFSIEMCS